MLYAIDIETIDERGKPCLDWRRGSILCIGICDDNLNTQILCPVDQNKCSQINELFSNPDNIVLMWNAVYDLTWLRQCNILTDKVQAKIYDPMLLYILMFNTAGLNASLRYCAQQFADMTILEWNKNITQNQLKEKNRQDIIATMKLWKIFYQMLEKLQDKDIIWKYFSELLMPVVDVFVNMQLRGIKVDKVRLNELMFQYKNSYDKQELDIRKRTGININSPKQLSYYLFNVLGLPTSRENTKSGYHPVDEGVLSELAHHNEICKQILEVKKLSRTLSVLKSIQKYIDSKTSRVYPHYDLSSAVSGRVCTSSPQVQNIPTQIRGIFIPEAGYKFISGDLSQIELRIISHLSGDKRLCEAYQKGLDLHQQTADMLGVDRKVGKTMNFAVLYGISPQSLARMLGISQQKAKEYISKFFEGYPELSKYIKQVHQSVQEKGYVYSMLGRKRFFSFVDNSSLRAAFDHIAQGTAADFLLVILRNLSRELKHGYIVNQIFDSVLLEVEKDYVDQTVELLRDCMTNFIKSPKLRVPIQVDIKVLDRWE